MHTSFLTTAKAFATIGFCCLMQTVSMNAQAGNTLDITRFPAQLSEDCNDNSAGIYDECANQRDILTSAIAQAAAEDKSVLVVYGAEWCSWCHSLTHAMRGEFQTTDNEWQVADKDIRDWTLRDDLSSRDIKAASALNRYIANNFVIAYINSDSDTVVDAIESTGLDNNDIQYLPYMFAIDAQGKFADAADPTSNAVFYLKRDSDDEFGGYNRVGLLAELKALRAMTAK